MSAFCSSHTALCCSASQRSRGNMCSSVLSRTSDVLRGLWVHLTPVWEDKDRMLKCIPVSGTVTCRTWIIVWIFIFVCEAMLFIPLKAMIEEAATMQTKLHVYKSDIQMLHCIYLDAPNTIRWNVTIKASKEKSFAETVTDQLFNSTCHNHSHLRKKQLTQGEKQTVSCNLLS